MNKLFLLLTVFVVVLAFTGCEWLFGPAEELVPVEETSLERLDSNRAVLEARNAALDPASAVYDDYSGAFMQTFAVEHKSGLNPQTLSIPMPPVANRLTAKATVPVYSGNIVFNDGGSDIYLDYPEPGLETEYVITAASGIHPDAFMITVTTTYPASSVIDTYIEEYYVRDVSAAGPADGEWTTLDPIVDNNGVTDQKYRVRMEAHFKDGSVRYETIVRMIFPSAPELNDGGADEDGFAAFNITDSLVYPDLAYPVTDANAVFSSVVVYTHEMADDYSTFSFWSGTTSQDIIGVRYYTEHLVDDGARLKGTVVAYEKAISTLVSQEGTLLDQLQDLFVGSEHDVLAESVFRKEVVFETAAGAIVPEAVAMNSIMRSHIVDISTYSDAEIQLFNDDGLKDLDWSGGTYYIPTGIAAEIADLPSDDEVIYYEKEGTYVANPADPANELIETVEVTGQGPSDLAVLYRAITYGLVTSDVDGGAANDIPDTIDDRGVVNLYNGDIGTSVADASIPDLTTAGTIEAWVYVDAHVNWGGIVHKGELADFSDEEFSLQFVDKKGKVGFCIVQQDPSYSYKMVKTKERLNLEAWYYIVGTWDASTINVYIFGDDGQGNPILVGSKSANNSIGEPYQGTGALVIGSQLLDVYNSSYGYFGFNGKINAVKVSAEMKSEADLLTFYKDNMALTAYW